MARHPEAAVALGREACVLAAIGHELTLSVPRPTYHDPSGCPPFTVHEEVPGAVLTKDIWLRMPDVVREAAAGDLANFLRASGEVGAHTPSDAVGSSPRVAESLQPRVSLRRVSLANLPLMAGLRRGAERC